MEFKLIREEQLMLFPPFFLNLHFLCLHSILNLPPFSFSFRYVRIPRAISQSKHNSTVITLIEKK